MEIEIKKRTKQIGLQVIELIEELPHRPAAWVISKQIVASSTSVGANYRAACRAKSTPAFANNLKIVKEADETRYGLEILEESQLIKSEKVESLKKEVNEIIAIIVASLRTIRNNKQ